MSMNEDQSSNYQHENNQGSPRVTVENPYQTPKKIKRDERSRYQQLHDEGVQVNNHLYMEKYMSTVHIPEPKNLSKSMDQEANRSPRYPAMLVLTEEDVNDKEESEPYDSTYSYSFSSSIERADTKKDDTSNIIEPEHLSNRMLKQELQSYGFPLVGLIERKDLIKAVLELRSTSSHESHENNMLVVSLVQQSSLHRGGFFGMNKCSKALQGLDCNCTIAGHVSNNCPVCSRVIIPDDCAMKIKEQWFHSKCVPEVPGMEYDGVMGWVRTKKFIRLEGQITDSDHYNKILEIGNAQQDFDDMIYNYTARQEDGNSS